MGYKIKEDLRTLTTTQTNFSKAISVTPQRVRQLIQEGTVIRDENDDTGSVYVLQSLKNYYSKRAGNSALDVNYDEEHALLEQIKRKTAEIKLEKTKSELYEARVVEQVMTQDFIKIRTQLLSLPVKLAGQIEGKSKAEIAEILTQEIQTALLELSTYDSKLFVTEELTNEN